MTLHCVQSAQSRDSCQISEKRHNQTQYINKGLTKFIMTLMTSDVTGDVANELQAFN